MDDREITYKLFEVVKDVVLSSGGDGEGYIISPNYRQLATLFEEYEQSGEGWFLSKDETDEAVTFSYGQEVICFSSNDINIPRPVEIIAKVPYL